jgi:hypothetical protein
MPDGQDPVRSAADHRKRSQKSTAVTRHSPRAGLNQAKEYELLLAKIRTEKITREKQTRRAATKWTGHLGRKRECVLSMTNKNHEAKSIPSPATR